MKIALLFYGKTREFEKCLPTWRKFVDHYKPDIFFHSWEDARPAHSFMQYLPKSYLVTSDIDFIRHQAGITNYLSSARNVLPQTYSISQAFQLKNEHERVTGEMYDWVVKTRFDLKLTNPTHINFGALDDQKLYVCDNHWGNGAQMFDDNIMIGNSGLLSSIYTTLFEYALEFIRINKAIPSGEQLLYDCICWRKLKESIVKSPDLNFDLARTIRV